MLMRVVRAKPEVTTGRAAPLPHFRAPRLRTACVCMDALRAVCARERLLDVTRWTLQLTCGLFLEPAVARNSLQMTDAWNRGSASSPWNFTRGDDDFDLDPLAGTSDIVGAFPAKFETEDAVASQAPASPKYSCSAKASTSIGAAQASINTYEKKCLPPSSAPTATTSRRQSISEGMGAAGIAEKAARRRGSKGEGPLAEAFGFGRRTSVIFARHGSVDITQNIVPRRPSVMESSALLEHQAALMMRQQPQQQRFQQPLRSSQPQQIDSAYPGFVRRPSTADSRPNSRRQSFNLDDPSKSNERRRSLRRMSALTVGEPMPRVHAQNNGAIRRASLSRDQARAANMQFGVFLQQQRDLQIRSPPLNRRPPIGPVDSSEAFMSELYARRESQGSRRRSLSHQRRSSPPFERGANRAKSAIELHGAACVIQRHYRGRKDRLITQKWIGAVSKLRKTFIDEKARDAGALENPLYSNAALAAREALRGTPQVIAALDEAWHACIRASGRPDATGMTREEYFVMARKIYLAIKCLDGDEDISVQDVLEAAEEDWIADSEGGAELSEEAFKHCWFQLADVHVDDIDATEYADWIREIVTEMTMTTEEQKADALITSKVILQIQQWRPDHELLDVIRTEAEISVRDFRRTYTAWCKQFEPEALNTGVGRRPARQRSRSDNAPPPSPRRSQDSILEKSSEADSDGDKLGKLATSAPPGRHGSRPGSSPRRSSVTPPLGVKVDPLPGEEQLEDPLPSMTEPPKSSFSRKLGTFNSGDETQTPSAMMRDAGLIKEPSVPGSPRSRPGSARPGSASVFSDRPNSGGLREITLADWQKTLEVNQTRPSTSQTRPSSASSTAEKNFAALQNLPRSGSPVGNPATWSRPASPRDERPWAREFKGRAPLVTFGARLLDLGFACNRLVAEISARCVLVSRDTGWPCTEVPVSFGSNVTSLPMTVLSGSPATSMKNWQLGARLMAKARTGIGEAELRSLCSRLAHPPLAKRGPNDYLPVLQG